MQFDAYLCNLTGIQKNKFDYVLPGKNILYFNDRWPASFRPEVKVGG
jgi:hypothetical protein